MDIKNTKIGLKVGFLIILLISVSFYLSRGANSSKNEHISIPKISGEELIDKVYVFTTLNNSLFFDKSLYFDKFRYYYISVMVVTPHECNMSITLWDPEDDIYEIFYREYMSQDENSRIPFGTVLAGFYSIRFDVELEYNLNIRIKIEKGEKCLSYDIDRESFENNKLYNVTKFHNGKKITEQTNILKTDYYYYFYFGRVSAISAARNSAVEIEYNITCPEDISYIIYENVSLPTVTCVSFFRFGTAIEGTYIANLTVYCDVPYVNIAYTVIEGGKISDIINGTEPEPTNGTDTPPFIISIPKEWTIGFVVVIGIIVVVIIGVVMYHRKRNIVNLSI